MQISGLNDSRDVDKFKLRETGLIKIDFFLISSLPTKDFSCLEQKIFIIFKFNNLLFELD